jgi:hypothetical protein
MNRSDLSPPIACTLEAAALRARENEFRRLFGRALNRIERPDSRSARLVLEAACEAETRDLFAREQRCCAFFEFHIALVDAWLVVDVRVPADAEPALGFLLGLAPQSLLEVAE